MPWAEDDRAFLRSLRIEANEPAPTPSHRFVVEPGVIDGEFHVVDRQKRSKDHIFGPPAWKQPREAAEDFARQMNEKHRAPVRPDDDGA